MVGINPHPGQDFAKRISSLESAVASLGTRDVLQNAAIGSGGITVDGGQILITDGGSILVQGTGFISLSAGTLTAATLNGTTGNITTVNATTVNATGVVASGTVSAATFTGGSYGAVNGTAAAFSGLVTSGSLGTGPITGSSIHVTGVPTLDGIINSAGTKANTVTVGYSAVYIDSSGNMGGNTSSRRFKTNIRPAGYDLDGVLALQPREYQRKSEVAEHGDAAPWQSGLIAEEVEKVAPRHVWHDADGRVEGIRYEELVVPLLAAIARERSERLADRAAFEARLAALERG